MPTISLKALAPGSLIDIGGSLVVGAGVVFVYGILLAAQNVPPEDMQRRVLSDPSYYVVALTVGLACMVLGAYVAARIARRREMLHAFLVGAIAIGFGLLFISSDETTMYPAWYLPVSFGLTIPAALVGGSVARRRATASQDANAA